MSTAALAALCSTGIRVVAPLKRSWSVWVYVCVCVFLWFYQQWIGWDLCALRVWKGNWIRLQKSPGTRLAPVPTREREGESALKKGKRRAAVNVWCLFVKYRNVFFTFKTVYASVFRPFVDVNMVPWFSFSLSPYRLPNNFVLGFIERWNEVIFCALTCVLLAPCVGNAWSAPAATHFCFVL